MATATGEGARPRGSFGAFRKRTYTLSRLLGHLRALAPRTRDVGAIWRGRMDAALREQIMLSVAEVNGCRYCCYVHTRWAQLEGVSAEDLARLEGLDPAIFDRDDWLAISHAVALADSDFAEPDSLRGGEIVRRSGAQRREDVETVARAMTFANLMANTLDAFLSRLRGEPAAGSRVLDEAVIAATLLLAGPFVVIVLAARLRISPVRFLREMLRLHGG